MRSRSSAGKSTIHRDAAGRWHGYVSMGVKDGGRRDRQRVSGIRRPDVVKRVRDLERKRDTRLAPQLVGGVAHVHIFETLECGRR